ALLDSVLLAYTLLTRIAAARGNIEQAHAWLDQAEGLAPERGWQRLIAATLFERVRLQLAEDRVTEAAACVSQLARIAAAADRTEASVSEEIDRYRSLGEASLAMARQRAHDAIAPLTAVLERFQQHRGDYLALRARTMFALACLAAGDRTRAADECREVLAAIESARAYRTILDQGPDVGDLLQAVRETMHAGHDKLRIECIDQIIERSRARYPGRHAVRDPARAPLDEAPAPEGLSTRERGVLNLIAAGQSNKEIARTLGIAPETVKSHIKNIFSKLSVEKRAQAVSRAQSLGLVVGH
ncbi:MAG: LuxR family transcriptional regulator, partial [Cupriavidus sp.]|nr:LuxR family transcriptional regulator [Cupriavidus sp.]